jgi:uncharacterized membrane protein
MNKIFKQTIIAGILAIMPFVLTSYILIWLFKFFSEPGQRFFEYFLAGREIPKYLPELFGFLFTFLVIYILGMIVRNVLGKRLFSKIEKAILKIPVANTIFNTIKQFTSSISDSKYDTFQKVVLIQYPRKGLWTITMVTGSSKDKGGREFYHLFVPTTPNPTSGYMIIIPKDDAVDSDLTIEEGLKAVISGGLLANEINAIPPRGDDNRINNDNK